LSSHKHAAHGQAKAAQHVQNHARQKQNKTMGTLLIKKFLQPLAVTAITVVDEGY